MKKSIYNTTIAINNKSALLYNARSDKFTLLTKEASNFIKKNSADSIAKENSKLFNDLVLIKALVNNNTNESEILQNDIKAIIENNDEFELHINPTLDCNFNCWYCYENHIKGSQMDERIVEATKNFISSTIMQKKSSLKRFHLSFFGGEPLLYFNRIALPLINQTQDICNKHNISFSVHFTTNGFLLNEKILNELKGINVSFQITLDGSKESHDKTRFLKDGTGSYEKICNNIKNIAQHKLCTCLRINYTSQNIESIASIVSSFNCIPLESKKYINIDFQRVWQDSDKDITDNQRVEQTLAALFKDFRESGFNVSYHRVQNSALFPCYGDKRNNVLINYDGNIYSCTARNFTPSNSEGTLLLNGDIQWKEDSKNKRIASKFSRAICHRCRIAPICGGGCTQLSLEAKDTEGCPRGLSEADIDKLILDRFDFMFLSNDKEEAYTKHC